jgi:3-hydroxyacyl-[acyl-carrier-protein] dehydratase
MDTSLDQALAALPHGPEFRFVDQVTALDPGRSASGLYLIKGSENFLKAHFPGNPMMPGVLMIEAIAQVAGIAAQNDSSDSPSSVNLRLAAVSQSKILGAAHPGDQLNIRVNITGSLGGLIQAEGTIAIVEDGNDNPPPIVKAQITLSLAS